MIPRETQEGAFYRAALALHQNHFQQAQAVSCGDTLSVTLTRMLVAVFGDVLTCFLFFPSALMLHAMCWTQN